MKEPGFVYILTNPSFREDWVKIGKSSRSVNIRSKELDNTAVPLPFEIFATLQTIKYDTEYEDNKPVKQYSMAETESAVVKDETAEELSHTTLSDKPKSTKKPRFKFSLVDIKIGEDLVFIPTGIHVKVASDDSIEYEGRIYKLSPFVGTFLPEDKQTPSGAYQGALYFTYKGERLTDLRFKKEMEVSESHE